MAAWGAKGSLFQGRGYSEWRLLLRCSGWRGLNGSELFAEKDRNPVEHQAERDLLINALKQALNTLNNEDKELLAHIYYLDNSLRKIAQKTGIPFTTLQYRHKKILKKLRLYFEQKFLSLD